MSAQTPAYFLKQPSSRRAGAAWSQMLVMLAGAAVLALVLYPMLRGGANGSGEGLIKWQTALAPALAQGRAGGTPVLVDFSASWCPPCQQMKSEVWPDDAVGKAVMAKVVPVFLDADGEEGKTAGRKYDVEQIPTIMLVDADGNVIRRHTGFMSREQVVKFIDNVGR